MNNQKSFEQLLKELVSTHKDLVANKFSADICTMYTHHAKSFSMREYIPITVKVKKNPMAFFDLDNNYFCDFQRVSELMEYADESFREKVSASSERQREDNIKLFRASLVEKANKETRTYFAKVGMIPNGKTTNPNGEGK